MQFLWNSLQTFSSLSQSLSPMWSRDEQIHNNSQDMNMVPFCSLSVFFGYLTSSVFHVYPIRQSSFADIETIIWLPLLWQIVL